MRLFLISLFFSSSAMAACPTLLDRTMTAIDEKPQSQYEGLEALYRTYASRGLVVLGFPMNDFGGQEPGSNQEIADFCVNPYAIDFPMFAKTDLKTNALFSDLARATGQAPSWNFHKYLVDRSGARVQSFGTRVAPADAKLIAAIERLLATTEEKRP